MLAAAMIAVLSLSAAWPAGRAAVAATSAGRPGHEFVANHAVGGPGPRLASTRGQHPTTGKVRPRDVLRAAILSGPGVPITPTILFRIGSPITEPPRRCNVTALPRLRGPPVVASGTGLSSILR